MTRRTMEQFDRETMLDCMKAQIRAVVEAIDAHLAEEEQS